VVVAQQFFIVDVLVVVLVVVVVDGLHESGVQCGYPEYPSRHLNGVFFNSMSNASTGVSVSFSVATTPTTARNSSSKLRIMGTRECCAG